MKNKRLAYFYPPFTPENIRGQYIDLCKRLHPDKGGNPENFKTMKAEYEFLQKLPEFKRPPPRPGATPEQIADALARLFYDLLAQRFRRRR